MSTPTNCNHDPKSHKFYDGCLGYEALVCPECGAYCDHTGAHPPDDWSRSFVGISPTTATTTIDENILPTRG